MRGNLPLPSAEVRRLSRRSGSLSNELPNGFFLTQTAVVWRGKAGRKGGPWAETGVGGGGGGGATLKPLTGETNPATMPRSAVKLPFIWMSLNTQRSTLSQIKFTANTGEDGL